MRIRAGRLRQGFTLAEIMLATLIFAFAFLPVSGLILQGVKQSDTGSTYTTAMDIAQGVMNAMQDPAVTMNQIPLTPLPLSITQFDDVTTVGSVGADPLMSALIPADYTHSLVGGNQTIPVAGYPYQIDVWTALLPNDTDLNFQYYKSPHVNYDAAMPGTCFYTTLILGGADYAQWSPYNETIKGAFPSHMYPDGENWATIPVSAPQSQFSTPTTNLTPPPGAPIYANLMKILLRVNWPRQRSGTGMRSFWLMTYKAQLQ